MERKKGTGSIPVMKPHWMGGSALWRVLWATGFLSAEEGSRWFSRGPRRGVAVRLGAEGAMVARAEGGAMVNNAPFYLAFRFGGLDVYALGL